MRIEFLALLLAPALALGWMVQPPSRALTVRVTRPVWRCPPRSREVVDIGARFVMISCWKQRGVAIHEEEQLFASK